MPSMAPSSPLGTSKTSTHAQKQRHRDNNDNDNKLANNIDKLSNDVQEKAIPLVRKEMIAKQRKSLPITSVENHLVEEIKSNDVLIIVGETGSGKTTQLPQFLFNAGFCHDGKIIGITQPRRVAAVSVAKWVADECGVKLSTKVGYSIRFDDMTSSSTRIKYMTDGLLLREALLDQYLSRYSVIIVDEAHERTVHSDVLLGLLKRVQKVRSVPINECLNNVDHTNPSNGMLMEKKNGAPPTSLGRQYQRIKLSPLKLIIMSASLDARVFSEYFGGARAVHVQGRQFPVDILYTRHPETDYVDATLITIFQIHFEEGPGDILVFLTGQEEIESVERLVREKLQQLPENSRKLKVLSIFSSLPSEKQMQVFIPAPSGFRKIQGPQNSKDRCIRRHRQRRINMVSLEFASTVRLQLTCHFPWSYPFSILIMTSMCQQAECDVFGMPNNSLDQLRCMLWFAIDNSTSALYQCDIILSCESHMMEK